MIIRDPLLMSVEMTADPYCKHHCHSLEVTTAVTWTLHRKNKSFLTRSGHTRRAHHPPDFDILFGSSRGHRRPVRTCSWSARHIYPPEPFLRVSAQPLQHAEVFWQVGP